MLLSARTSRSGFFQSINPKIKNSEPRNISFQSAFNRFWSQTRTELDRCSHRDHFLFTHARLSYKNFPFNVSFFLSLARFGWFLACRGLLNRAIAFLRRHIQRTNQFSASVSREAINLVTKAIFHTIQTRSTIEWRTSESRTRQRKAKLAKILYKRHDELHKELFAL